MLVVLIELSELTVKLGVIEQSIRLLAVGQRVCGMAQGVGDLVEGQVELVQLLGRLVVGERERGTGLALLDDLFQGLVEVDDLLGHPLGSLACIDDLDDTDQECQY